LRQAYDYWQNQPGNYLEPRRPPGGWDGEGNPKRGRACYKVGNAHCTDPAGGGSRSEAQETHTITDHSFAPTEFPKGRSATAQSGPRTRHARQHAPLRWRVAITKSAPGGGYWRKHSPQKDLQDSSESPTVYRAQQCCLRSQGLAGLRFLVRAENGAIISGTHLPATNKHQELRATAVGELTRVDIACRHLGRTRADKKPLQIQCGKINRHLPARAAPKKPQEQQLGARTPVVGDNSHQSWRVGCRSSPDVAKIPPITLSC
jgi:hypothetical protein